MTRVAVLLGGRSSEAEVSRSSGTEVIAALRERGHDAVGVEADAKMFETLRDGGFEVAFVALHGRFGEDGTVQGVCELLDLPYTGSGVLATALALDKQMTKRVLRSEGIPTPDWRVLPRGLESGATAAMGEAAAKLGLPLVVKPNRAGSTLGLSIVHEAAGLAGAYWEAEGYDRPLLETFVAGTEITVGVLGDNEAEALPTLEIVSHRPVYDYAAKYTRGQSEHVIPARLPEEQRRDAQRIAERVHVAVGCRGMSRVDLVVTPDGTPWVLEVNTIPGLTGLSLLPDAARAAGIAFPELCQRLLRGALRRHDEEMPR